SCGFWCFWSTRFRNELLCMSLLNHRLVALSRSQLGFFPQLVFILPIFLALVIGLLLFMLPCRCSLCPSFSHFFKKLFPCCFSFLGGRRKGDGFQVIVGHAMMELYQTPSLEWL